VRGWKPPSRIASRSPTGEPLAGRVHPPGTEGREENLLGRPSDEVEYLLEVLSGAYSRRINVQNRLVYQILPEARTVKVIRMWTHYE
jgi:hypothetical protein